MEEEQIGIAPARCPVCNGDLLVTRLECSSCGTEVNGTFTLGHLATLREPHASLIEMFLRVRGNVKEMERELGLSYPTVRAHLEKALEAAGFGRAADRGAEGAGAEQPWEVRFEADLTRRIQDQVEASLAGLSMRAGRRADSSMARAERERELAARRAEILEQLERGEIGAAEAAALLRQLKSRR